MGAINAKRGAGTEAWSRLGADGRRPARHGPSPSRRGFGGTGCSSATCGRNRGRTRHRAPGPASHLGASRCAQGHAASRRSGASPTPGDESCATGAGTSASATATTGCGCAGGVARDADDDDPAATAGATVGTTLPADAACATVPNWARASGASAVVVAAAAGAVDPWQGRYRQAGRITIQLGVDPGPILPCRGGLRNRTKGRGPLSPIQAFKGRIVQGLRGG